MSCHLNEQQKWQILRGKKKTRNMKNQIKGDSFFEKKMISFHFFFGVSFLKSFFIMLSLKETCSFHHHKFDNVFEIISNIPIFRDCVAGKQFYCVVMFNWIEIVFLFFILLCAISSFDLFQFFVTKFSFSFSSALLVNLKPHDLHNVTINFMKSQFFSHFFHRSLARSFVYSTSVHINKFFLTVISIFW